MPKIYVRNKKDFQKKILEAGTNFKEFSYRCGVSQAYMSRIVNGKINLSGVLSKKILDNLDAFFDEIFFIE